MPSKSKIHLKNVIKITIGEMKKRKATRRRRRVVSSGVGVNQAHKLLSEIQSLSSIARNVSNPQGSNSSTLLHKIHEVETENKIKSLENQLHHVYNNVPRLPPSTNTQPQTTSNRLIEYQTQPQTTLADVANGLMRDQENLNRRLQHYRPYADSIYNASIRPHIEEVQTPPTSIRPIVAEVQSPPPLRRSLSGGEETPTPPPLRRSLSGGGGEVNRELTRTLNSNN